MKLRTLKNLRNFQGKKVLLRVDFNVPMERGRILDDFRLRRTMPTIKFLKKGGAKIILLSHLTKGRARSLRPVAESLKIPFGGEILSSAGLEKISQMKNGSAVLFENIRRYPEEEKNSLKFAKKLASLGDIFVNDAFSAAHRRHSTIVGIPKYLPSFAGLLMEEEFENLSTAFKPSHPFLLVLGGIKFKTKLGVLARFIRIADKIFIGGALANNFFLARGEKVGSSIIDKNVDIRRYVNNPKIILPVDVRKSGGMILDCGPQTIKMLSEVIDGSKFILWNGPVGDFERRGFEKGTEELARLIAASSARTIIGGGDTIAAVRQAGGDRLLKKFSFVSTGGGAMLEFLAKGTLPGIKALSKS